MCLRHRPDHHRDSATRAECATNFYICLPRSESSSTSTDVVILFIPFHPRSTVWRVFCVVFFGVSFSPVFPPPARWRHCSVARLKQCNRCKLLSYFSQHPAFFESSNGCRDRLQSSAHRWECCLMLVRSFCCSLSFHCWFCAKAYCRSWVHCRARRFTVFLQQPIGVCVRVTLVTEDDSLEFCVSCLALHNLFLDVFRVFREVPVTA